MPTILGINSGGDFLGPEALERKTGPKHSWETFAEEFAEKFAGIFRKLSRPT